MNEWQTIPEMVLSAGERFGDAEAIVDGSLRITFTELTDRVRRAANPTAARLTRSVSSVKVIRNDPSTTAYASPKSSPALQTLSGSASHSFTPASTERG